MSGKIFSDKAPPPVGLYPHARRAGDFLFLSGVGPRLPGSAEVPGLSLDQLGNIVSYDMEAQCHSVFRNVRAILEEAGAEWEDRVDITVFLTKMKTDFLSSIAFTPSIFGRTNRPAPPSRS